MSIHTAMRKVLITGQIFGLMPIRGILQTDISNLKFSWMSWKTLYSMITLLGMTFMGCIQLKKIVSGKNNMVDIYKQASYLSAILTCVLFIMLAKDWPRIMKKWNAVETSMVGYGTPTGLNKKINRIVVIFYVLLLIRYILTQLHQLIRATECKNKLGDGVAFKSFLKLKFVNVCTLFECDILAGILLLYVNIQIIFSHTYVDVFIMVISESLASRLNQITKRIKSIALAKIKSEEIWAEIREDYNTLEILCKSVNSHIYYIILLSFVRNLALVLIHLFNSLKVRRSFTQTLYFYYSFWFLVIRTAFVCILGSTVNEESKKSLIYLYKVPAAVYNKEIERLIRQVSMSNMALSGMNFFRIKRDLVLKIAGALVTYELILIQFAGDSLKTSMNSTCSL